MAAITQTLENGLRQDIDPIRQPTGTYRQLTNGRMLVNPVAGEPTMGHSGTLTNPPGTAPALLLPEGQQHIGDIDTGIGTVILSTDGVTSQIGLWAFDPPGGMGGYTVLYDDRFDPHLSGQPYRRRVADDVAHDRLGWQITDEADLEAEYSNQATERVYFTNRRGPKFVMNIRSVPARLADGYYPSYFSVHGFRDRPDVTWPIPQLNGRCPGRLLSGVYQLAMQYTHPDGVQSVISPVTRRIFVTTKPLDDPDPVRQAALRVNHHNRVMEESGVLTTEGLEFTLLGVDVRWQKVRPVLLYYATEGIPSRIVALPGIDTATATPRFDTFLNQLTFRVTQLTGEELSLSDLLLRHEVIEAVQTLKSDRDRLIEAGLLKAPTDLKFLVDDAQAVPLTKLMGSDMSGNPAFAAVANPISGRPDGDPLTNSVIQTTSVNRRLFTGVSIDYAITSDYANDKGQVWEWLHGSFPRGETEKIGIQLFDRQGQPLFVAQLADITIPNQYDRGPNGEVDLYTLTGDMPGFNVAQPRLMGLNVSGLLLPVDRLYDAAGQLRVSGFQLVRRPRERKMLHQGVIFPVCGTDDCLIADGKDDVLFGLPIGNYFEVAPGLPDRYQYGYATPCVGDRQKPSRTFSRPHLFTYHSPDLLIEGAMRPIQAGDVLRHVGLVAQQTGRQPTVALVSNGLTGPTHTYAKSYDTHTPPLVATADDRRPLLTAAGRPRLGSTTRISDVLLHNGELNHTYEKWDKTDLNSKFETQMHPALVTLPGPPVLGLFAHGQLGRNCVLMRSMDWKAVDAAPTYALPHGYRLVNYEQLVVPPTTSTDPAAGDAAAIGQPYEAIGHFQPLTPAWLDRAVKVTGSRSRLTHYRFDDMELFGGPMYVQFMDHLRVYPYPSDDCSQNDYAVGNILPIETKYNLMLRPGRTLAKNGIRPEVASCTPNSFPQLEMGIMPGQPENWDYNRSLLVTTSIVPYQQQPPGLVPVIDQPSGFVFSPRRSLTARLNAWRQHLVGDTGQLEGRRGAIVQMVRSESTGLVVYQTGGAALIPLEVSQYQAGADGIIQTDSGSIFRKEVPLSNRYGTQHPRSVWALDGQVGAWDARRGVLHRLAGGIDVMSVRDGIDDSIQAISAPLATAPFNVPGYGAQAGVDARTGEVLISLFAPGQPTQTWVYQTRKGLFMGTYPVDPRHYISRGNGLYSVDQVGSQLHRHNTGPLGSWYGVVKPTVLQLVVAPGGEASFDTVQLGLSASAASRLVRLDLVASGPDRSQNDSAYHHTILPQTDARCRYENGVYILPLHEWDWAGEKRPLRAPYLLMTLTFDNTSTAPVLDLSRITTLIH